MEMRFRFLPGLLVSVLLLALSACKTSSSTSVSGTGALFVATQGDSLVSAYTIDLTTGKLTANGAGVATGTTPSAMLLVPSGSALFIVNSNPAITPTVPPTPCQLPDGAGTISAYTVKSDGTLSPASGSATAGLIPLAMATDSGAHFLFVANQGLQCNPASGTISVFSIQDATLTKVSDVQVADPLASSNPGPTAIAVTPDGKFLYVANQFDGTVTGFSVDASGVLTRLTPGATATVGTAPAGIDITPDGGFLYVANSGSSNVSAFAICNQVVTSCSIPASPDGALTPVTGSPFSAGLGPASIVAAPSGKFLFVVDRQSNQISEYKLATGTGELTPNTQASISTGSSPAGAALRVGTTVVSTTQGTTDYLYVPDLGASSMTAYSFDSTAGILGLLGSPVTTGGQPSAVATK
jgi:6-phosphogluconolactonase (cycloisomerase 2 family)